MNTGVSDDAELVLQQFHCCLNCERCVPRGGYRRNVVPYRLICYVNNIIGTTLSGNYQVAALFVARAVEQMDEFPPSQDTLVYYTTVRSYLAHVVFYIRNSGPSVEFDATRIPASILHAGPQAVPDPSPCRG